MSSYEEVPGEQPKMSNSVQILFQKVCIAYKFAAYGKNIATRRTNYIQLSQRRVLSLNSEYIFLKLFINLSFSPLKSQLLLLRTSK